MQNDKATCSCCKITPGIVVTCACGAVDIQRIDIRIHDPEGARPEARDHANLSCIPPNAGLRRSSSGTMCDRYHLGRAKDCLYLYTKASSISLPLRAASCFQGALDHHVRCDTRKNVGALSRADTLPLPSRAHFPPSPTNVSNTFPTPLWIPKR